MIAIGTIMVTSNLLTPLSAMVVEHGLRRSQDLLVQLRDLLRPANHVQEQTSCMTCASTAILFQSAIDACHPLQDTFKLSLMILTIKPCHT